MPPDRHTLFSASLPFLPRLDPDVALVRQFRATGDPALFETLFRKYQTPIFSFVVRMVNGEDAYDLTQEVFYRAMRSLADFKGDCKFRTWLFTIARHVCLNHLRDIRQREQTEDYSLDDHSETGGGPELSDPGPAVGRIVETRELQRLVERALSMLPPEQRLLITLRDLEGQSYEEICTITEMSLVNVKSKLHRARLAFKTQFEPYLSWVHSEDDK
ncbi:MAG: sigma-70 family RNA polymerase sigma factor [Armatimonadota bacterium]|nr:sigma-70 family RNA polymerase sigma factor [Armatimonadota bacterium]